MSDAAGKRKGMGTKTDHLIWQHGGHGDLGMISFGCSISMGVDLRKNRRRGAGHQEHRHACKELCCKVEKKEELKVKVGPGKVL